MANLMKVFRVERSGETVILTPRGIAAQFRYAEVHTESNTVIQKLDQHEVDKLVVDLTALQEVDGIMIETIIRIVRRVTNRGGNATICGASQATLKTLREMRLDTVWPHFPSREEALQSLEESP